MENKNRNKNSFSINFAWYIIMNTQQRSPNGICIYVYVFIFWNKEGITIMSTCRVIFLPYYIVENTK